MTELERLAFLERQAEENMLKTHKLEGSHYAAMKQVMAECPGHAILWQR